MSEPTPDDPLARALVRMRRVDEPEAPFPGWLARADDDLVQVVDVGALRGWPGWRSRGGHVLSVVDVARTANGHEGVVPWCVERVDGFLARRAGAGAALSAGESVTIAVSLLRGCRAARGIGLRGEWWLTHDGTPTFVAARQDGPAGDLIGDAGAALLERIASASGLARAWRVSDLVTWVRNEQDTAEGEARVFASATPEPLVLTPLTPRRAADARRVSVGAAAAEPEPRESLFGRLVRGHVDADVGDLVSVAMEGARRGARRARERLARPWLVAAGLAGVILVAGFVWPSTTTPAANAGADASSAASPSATEATDVSSSTDVGGASPSAGAADDPDGGAAPDAAASESDPVLALGELLTRRSACSESSCAANVFEDAMQTEVPAGAVDLPENERDVVLLDDLGGVAVLSVTGVGGRAPTQLVVVVDTADGWRIRDVRDVDAP